MKWEYIGTGLGFVGIGVTLMVALPPPWWLKMPPVLITIGLVAGAALIFVGVVAIVFGVWAGLPEPRIPIIGMGVAGLALIFFAAWFFLFPVVRAEKLPGFASYAVIRLYDSEVGPLSETV